MRFCGLCYRIQLCVDTLCSVPTLSRTHVLKIFRHIFFSSVTRSYDVSFVSHVLTAVRYVCECVCVCKRGYYYFYFARERPCVCVCVFNAFVVGDEQTYFGCCCYCYFG